MNKNQYEQIIDILLKRIDHLERLIGQVKTDFVDSLTTTHSYKPHSEVDRLRLFMETFNAIAGDERNDVSVIGLMNELCKTGKFTESEANAYIIKAMQNGQIYQRKEGVLAKA
jgi:hypothetical protein